MKGSIQRHALTLLEILAVVTIVGIIALLAISRTVGITDDAQATACYVNIGDIEVQVQLWFRQTGVWPAEDLSDIGADPAFFPEGLPVCPVDRTRYTLDRATHEVTGHNHD